MANEKDNNEKNIDFAISTMKQKLSSQSRATQALDTKAGILIGFVSVVAANLVIILKDKPQLVKINLFTIGLTILLYALVKLIQAATTKEYLDPPDFDAFYSDKALAKENMTLKNEVAADMKQSYIHNNKLDGKRAMAFDRSIYALAISIILLIIGARGA